MSDVKMPKSVPCKFDEKGWAPCEKPSTNGWCSKHEKIKCVSCGAHAVRGCDAGMGGLECGVNLCKTCQHGLDGKHVTKKVYIQQTLERSIFDRTGSESGRMLAERGVPNILGLPCNLKELLEGNRRNFFTCKPCWALELKHGLMGFFPATVKEQPKVMVITSDRDSIFRVWRSLAPRDSKLIALECMVNDAGTVGYVMRLESDSEKKQSLPLKIFSADEIEELFAKDPAPFVWAPGLLGARIDKGHFKTLIEREEKRLRAHS